MNVGFLEIVAVGYDAGMNSEKKDEKLFRIWEFNADGVMVGMQEFRYQHNSSFHDQMRRYSQDGKTKLFQMVKDETVKGKATRYSLVDDMKVVCLMRYGADGFPDMVDFFDVTNPIQFKELSERLINCGKEGYPLI